MAYGMVRYRFNEAPIHESGKCALNARFDGGIRGFNEAPIHESGKLRQDGCSSEP